MATAPTKNAPVNLTVSNDWYREWFDSPYYHKLYFQHNEAEAAGFIRCLLDLLTPPPASALLDVACGRGRHARMLAARGFDTTGIDLAPSSIAFARQFENDHLHFYIHDMRQLLCTNCFDYAFNFFTSFGYFMTRRENLNTIRMVGAALKPGGVFVLDYLNVRYVEQHLVPNEVKVIDGVTYTITRWCEGKHFFKKIVISDEKLPQPLEYIERVAMFGRDDFESLFLPNGLQIRQQYGNFQLEPFDPDRSPRLILVAEKK
ncbi:MAG TPA: class I SAM-dependent methyltransferase [Puia sp.]|jgi:SAM-dependent methyltransferase|nr:class I SAM-dependent methyltransferase [Puia sp.]